MAVALSLIDWISDPLSQGYTIFAELSKVMAVALYTVLSKPYTNRK